MKLGLFLGDFFWSSIPYDGLILYNYLLSKGVDIDLLMFDKDIRLNKKFRGNEMFKFDPEHFQNVKRLVQLKEWNDFFKVTQKYNAIISPVHIVPKTRQDGLTPTEFRGKLKVPLCMYDIGGTDLLAKGVKYADVFFVKGQIWKEWLIKMGIDCNKVFVTGSPHYDFYFDDERLLFGRPLSRKEFYTKYNIDDNKELLLLSPSNPSSHKEQFVSNQKVFSDLMKICEKSNTQIIVKTYPHDYVFYEDDHPYSGVYKRKFNDRNPQYNSIQKELPGSIVIESQDHFAALHSASKMFNISGSHVAWETFFTQTCAYSMNYRQQAYYAGATYLPEYVRLPDEYFNHEIGHISEIMEQKESRKSMATSYMENHVSLDSIYAAIQTFGGVI